MARRTEPSVYDSLMFQASSCDHLGSPMYGALLRSLAENHAHGGVIAKVTANTSARALRDALSLRLLGTVHRMVLSGEVPALARHYPSVGGTPNANLATEFVTVVNDRFDDVAAGLERQVQTNEVGRCAALVGGFALVARRSGLPLRLLELGSSAGLNLRWDRYGYSTETGVAGDPASPVRFADWATAPDLDGEVAVASRRGCDIAPLDAADPAAQLTLLSFVWPEQTARFARLRDALRIAAEHPVVIDRADAAEWLEERLAEPPGETATVVFHSIVWQYMPPESQARIRQLLTEHATAAPLYWLRLEPAGQVADLRLTSCPSGDEEVLATAGYHGADVAWSGPRS